MPDYKIKIDSVKKQNRIYYSVFFKRWTTCECSAVSDTVLILSDDEITLSTEGLNDLVQKELAKRK